ncbi:MAG: hypothetical protein KGL39_12035 [Patescibacteria group bacterium]|nr:hypothetical protein [Patescibacteria group bacterium]
MDLPNLSIKLPTPDIDSSRFGKSLLKAAVGELFGHGSMKSFVVGETVGLVQKGAEGLVDGAASESGDYNGSSMEARRQEWEEWLRTLQRGVIDVAGDPGEGKTTCCSDLCERYFERNGHRIYWIGVSQDLLPRGWHEISIASLYKLGQQIEKAAKNGEDPKGILGKFLPARFVVVVDDAGLYLRSGDGASSRPQNAAVRGIVQVCRHLDGIVILNFKHFRTIDIEFVDGADAQILKRSDSTSDRWETREMLEHARAYFQKREDRASDAGLTLKEVKQDRQLLAWVKCSEAGFEGPWRHRRPDWYDERFSRNALSDVVELGDSDYRVLDEETFEAAI